MATASDVLAAVRATLSGLSGWKEAQQLYADHSGTPEVDRSWAVEMPDTTDLERMRGDRARQSRINVSLARRVKTPGPQASVASIISEAEAIRDALEGTTAAGVSGISVDRALRRPSADRSHFIILLEASCLHTQA